MCGRGLRVQPHIRNARDHIPPFALCLVILLHPAEQISTPSKVWACNCPPEITMLILLILLLLIFGGGGGYYGYSQWGLPGAGGILLLVIIILFFFGRGRL